MNQSKATRDAYAEALLELGEKNDDIVVVDADLSVSTQSCKFQQKFPERFFDVGCAEQDLLGTAAGLAAGGKIAFASTYSIFASGRAWEQIRSLIAHDRLDVKIVVSHAGLTNAPDGASHQSLEDIALMRVIPDLCVIVPADFMEAKKAIIAAAGSPGPAYIRLSRAKTPVLYDDSYEFSIGKGSVLRDGSDISIIACGPMVSNALAAADLLKAEGVNARVINMPTIKPLDTALIEKAAKETGAILTVEEHGIHGGLGSAVAEYVAQGECRPLLKIMGVNDCFGQSGTYEELLEEYGLTASSIQLAAKELYVKVKG